MRSVVVCALLVTSLMLYAAPSPARAAVDLTHLSCLGKLSAGTITRLDPNQPTKPITSATFFSALSALHGSDIWVGYEHGGWDIQGTKTWESVIVIQPQGYQIWIMKSSAAPQLRYIWAFRSMSETADSNGNHLGNHDFCAAMSVAARRIDYLYRLAGVE